MISDTASIEKQVHEIEERLKKQSKYTLIVAILAALLGSGGIASVLAITYERPVEAAETQLKTAEADSKFIANEVTRHKESIAALERIITGLEKSGDREKALTVQKFMLQQELDFQKFFSGMNTAMKSLWKTNPEAAKECREVLDSAERDSQVRYAALVDIFK